MTCAAHGVPRHQTRLDCIMDEIDRVVELNQARLESGLSRISAALAGMGADECEECGTPIPAARRKAMPSATLCVSCQSQLERHRAS